MASTEHFERERADLTRKLAGLESEQKRIFYVAPGVVLAIPAGIFFGPLLAIGVVALVLGIIGVGLYIIHGHRYEYETMLRQVDEKIAMADRPQSP